MATIDKFIPKMSANEVNKLANKNQKRFDRFIGESNQML